MPPAGSIAHIATFTPQAAPTQAQASASLLHSMPPPQANEPQAKTMGQPMPPAAGSQQPTPSFLLSKSSPPIPGKLVAKIQSLQFVEMRELLPDNIALLERLATLPQGSAVNTLTQQREVSSLLTWVCAFATYVAILAESNPELVKRKIGLHEELVKEAAKF